MGTTYSEERHIAVRSVDPHGELPSIPISQRGDDGLQRAWGGQEDAGAESVALGEDRGDGVGDEVGC